MWPERASSCAKSSNTCAVLPDPASKTMFRPLPPQSRTSSWMPPSTVTNCTLWGEGSRHSDDSPWANPNDGKAMNVAAVIVQYAIPTAEFTSVSLDLSNTGYVQLNLVVGGDRGGQASRTLSIKRKERELVLTSSRVIRQKI